MIQQRTEEWFKQRLGKVTASRISDVMASKTSEAYANYQAELICGRLTGVNEESYASKAMIRGIELEPQAMAHYMLETGEIVKEVGFCEHPTINNAGASPDGLVGDDGLIEIKCPNTTTHIKLMVGGAIPKKYLYQMQWQMSCTDRKWCDFVSYDDRLPEHLAIKIIRVNRDDDLISSIESAVIEFLEKVSNIINELQKET